MILIFYNCDSYSYWKSHKQPASVHWALLLYTSLNSIDNFGCWVDLGIVSSIANHVDCHVNLQISSWRVKVVKSQSEYMYNFL